MNGAAAWTLEELERVGALLGESLADVVAPGGTEGSVSGMLSIGKAGCPANCGSAEPPNNHVRMNWWPFKSEANGRLCSPNRPASDRCLS
jgi:hypothetical protein